MFLIVKGIVPIHCYIRPTLEGLWFPNNGDTSR